MHATAARLAAGTVTVAVQARGRPVERTSPPSCRSTVAATTREPKPKRAVRPVPVGRRIPTQEAAASRAARLARDQVPSRCAAARPAPTARRAWRGNSSPTHGPPWRRAAPPPAPGAVADHPAGSARGLSGRPRPARYRGEFASPPARPDRRRPSGCGPAAGAPRASAATRPSTARRRRVGCPPGSAAGRLHHREDVLGAVVDLPRQQDLPLRASRSSVTSLTTPRPARPRAMRRRAGAREAAMADPALRAVVRRTRYSAIEALTRPVSDSAAATMARSSG